MPTKRLERIALAQLLVAGCAVAFSVCGLIEPAQAQATYVPPPPTQSPTVNPSNPGTVPQPSYRPITPSTPSITPSTPSSVPSVEATPPANEEHPSTTSQSKQPSVHAVHRHYRGRSAGLTWPYYCGSSPCVRIHPRAFYGYAAPYASSTLWWPGFYDYPPGQFAHARPRYGGYGRRSGYHGD